MLRFAVQDPDLEGSHPVPLMGGGGGGGGGPRKKMFGPFGPQFGLRIRGGPEPPWPLPWIRHWFASNRFYISGALNENIVQNHLKIALLNVF